jgi:hypothetical protein
VDSKEVENFCTPCRPYRNKSHKSAAHPQTNTARPLQESRSTLRKHLHLLLLGENKMEFMRTMSELHFSDKTEDVQQGAQYVFTHLKVQFIELNKEVNRTKTAEK